MTDAEVLASFRSSGSIYEVKVTVEFTTGCTGNSEETARMAVQEILMDQLREAKIVGIDNVTNGLFAAEVKATVMNTKVTDLRKQHREEETDGR